MTRGLWTSGAPLQGSMGVRGPSFESMKTCFSPLHLSFGTNSDFPEVKIFFWSSPTFGLKIELFWNRRPFFFGLHLIFG